MSFWCFCYTVIMKNTRENLNLEISNNNLESVNFKNQILSGNFNTWFDVLHNLTPENEALVFDIYKELVYTDIKKAHELIEHIGQNPVSNPQAFIDTTLDILSSPDIPRGVETDLLYIINAQYWYQPENFQKIFTEKLDFINTENFFQTGVMLDFLTKFLSLSDQDDSFFTRTVSYFENLLQDKKDKNQGSFILQERLSILLESRKIHKTELQPFKLNDTYYAFVHKNNFYVCDNVEDNLKIQNILDMLSDIDNGNIPIQNHRYTEQEIENIFLEKGKKLNTLISNKITIEDIYDFGFICRKSIRDRINKLFDIDQTKLSLQEQLYINTYLKTVNVENLQGVIDFSNKFHETGLKTFLSVEHGGRAMGDIIIELESKLEHSDAEKIFIGYSQLVDATEKLRISLEHNISGISELDTQSQEKIPFEITDALMLRAKDILLGAHKVAMGGEKIDVTGVINALMGITQMIEIIADLKDNKKFVYTKTLETDKNHKYTIFDPETKYMYDLKVFLRPYAEKNAQARINFELSFDTKNPNPVLQQAFYNEIISFAQDKTTKASVLRIGIDREDHNGIGHISLDLGRSERTDDVLSRTGDVLGNLLEIASTTGHHTTEPFSPEFGDSETFANIVHLLEKALINHL